MGLMTSLKLGQQDIAKMTAEDVATIAIRLEQDEYDSPFAALEDWHLLRAIAFQREELVEPYVHLLDIEAYDEA
jgi:type IV secretory pathway ATPase VirB11/archaellum biosynthesis ATPase